MHDSYNRDRFKTLYDGQRKIIFAKRIIMMITLPHGPLSSGGEGGKARMGGWMGTGTEGERKL